MELGVEEGVHLLSWSSPQCEGSLLRWHCVPPASLHSLPKHCSLLFWKMTDLVFRSQVRALSLAPICVLWFNSHCGPIHIFYQSPDFHITPTHHECTPHPPTYPHPYTLTVHSSVPLTGLWESLLCLSPYLKWTCLPGSPHVPLMLSHVSQPVQPRIIVHWFAASYQVLSISGL